MAQFTQLPGVLDITFVGGGGTGDEVAIALDFDKDLTSYQIAAPIYATAVYASAGGGEGAVSVVGQTAASFAVQATNLATGQVTIALTEAQTGSLSPGTAYRWYMRWVSPAQVTRTVLSGVVTVVSP